MHYTEQEFLEMDSFRTVLSLSSGLCLCKFLAAAARSPKIARFGRLKLNRLLM